MQNCFRAHPEVYADEIMDDDNDEETTTANGANVPPAEHSESEGKLSGDALLSPEKPRLDSAQAAKDSS
jgi:intermembrane space import and assembly protein 40